MTKNVIFTIGLEKKLFASLYLKVMCKIVIYSSWWTRLWWSKTCFYDNIKGSIWLL